MICEQMPKAELRVVSGMRFEEFFLRVFLALAKIFIFMQIRRMAQQLVLHLVAAGFTEREGVTHEQRNFVVFGAVGIVAGTVDASSDHDLPRVKGSCNLLECSHKVYLDFSAHPGCDIARQEPKARATTLDKSSVINSLDQRSRVASVKHYRLRKTYPPKLRSRRVPLKAILPDFCGIIYGYSRHRSKCAISHNSSVSLLRRWGWQLS